jgi:hypothetical protein
MPTVIISYADKAVKAVGIRWEYQPLHLSVPSDDGRSAPTPLICILNLLQNQKIHTNFAFVFAVSRGQCDLYAL